MVQLNRQDHRLKYNSLLSTNTILQMECFSRHNGRAHCGTEMYNVLLTRVFLYYTIVLHRKTDANAVFLSTRLQEDPN